MNILKGTVSASRATTAISGGGNDSSVQTTHILLFKVDGRQVKISAASPAMMSDNDLVTLAGTEKNGAFVALAYRNETTGVAGDVGKLGPVIGVLLGFVATGVSLTVFNGPAFGYIPKIVGLVFLAVGIFSAVRLMRIKSAIDLLAANPM